MVELTGIESGAGRSASIYNIEGEFVDLPADELHRRAFAYRRTTDETLQYGDRLLITVRGDFILDECCRALDADHLGGGVPLPGDAELRARRRRARAASARRGRRATASRAASSCPGSTWRSEVRRR